MVVSFIQDLWDGLAFGQVEDKIVAANGADVSYSVATFDSINIGSSTVVQVGSSGVILKTQP